MRIGKTRYHREDTDAKKDVDMDIQRHREKAGTRKRNIFEVWIRGYKI